MLGYESQIEREPDWNPPRRNDWQTLHRGWKICFRNPRAGKQKLFG